MDMKIAGSGSIGPGEYENVRISGSGKIEGPIRCRSLHGAGSVHGRGLIEASEEISLSGSVHAEGDLLAKDLRISGSGAVDGSCTIQNEARIAGSFRCDGRLKAERLHLAGSIRAANAEAEEVRVVGTIECPGLLNAERFHMEIKGGDSQLGSIGGSVVDIDRAVTESTGKFRLFRRKSPKERGRLTVRESIEGDEITLAHVTAQAVIGRVVRLGAGCRIGEVQYSESIEIDPDAKVELQKRV